MKCPICEMKFFDVDTNDCIYATSCGHVLHKDCLMTWLQNNNSCPLCRECCSKSSIFQLYFSPNFEDQEEGLPSSAIERLETSFCAANSEVQQKFDEISSMFGNFSLTFSSWEEKNKKLTEENESLKDRIAGMQTETDELLRKIRTLESNSYLDKYNLPFSSMAEKNRKFIEENECLKDLIAGMQAETDDLLEKIRALENNLDTEKINFRELQESNNNFRLTLSMWEEKNEKLTEENENLQDRIAEMQAEKESLHKKIKDLGNILDADKSYSRKPQEANILFEAEPIETEDLDIDMPRWLNKTA